MRIALAQINTKVGDLKGNTDLIINYIDKAVKLGAELVVFPELSITGYPPRDLLDFEYFVKDNIAQLEKIKPHTKNIGVLVGFVDINQNPVGKKYHNAAALIHNGEILTKYYKSLLPFYDVFDETRYFESGKEFHSVEFLGKKIGITICEDIWNDKCGDKECERAFYELNPIEELVKQDVDVILNLSASPYWIGKETDRYDALKDMAKKYSTPIVYVNQAGGNDDLVFDGSSFAVDQSGEIRAMASDFKEDIVIYSLNTNIGDIHPISDSVEKSLFKALRMGLKDYCIKSGFKRIVLGLSGGIDSAVSAVIASYALGSRNVMGIAMPSMYSSSDSVTDAEALAKKLDIQFHTVPIKGVFDAFVDTIQPSKGLMMDLAEENLQARIRGNILMTYSNRYGSLLLSTGNKSELAVGYCTLYGDMAGGLDVLSDIPKTMVYRLAEFINASKEIIPYSTIVKPPSAELRPDQKDQDSLPPYDVLDDILKLYIEDRVSPKEIAKKYGKKLVEDIIRKVNLNEYKRRQATLGLKVTTKAFGSGRRFPIVQGYGFQIKD